MAIRLINRADDIGSSLIANEAIIDAHKDGMVTATSIMVPAPHFEDAAARLRDCPSLEVGLHATITDEWDSDRWGPVLPVEEVPSIVYDDGTFFKNCVELWERYGDEKTRPSNDEIINELRAQLNKARDAGLTVTYLDAHMGFSWFHGLDDRLQEFCDEEGILYSLRFECAGFPEVEGEFDDPIDKLVAQINAFEDGKTYRLVGHPAYDRGDMVNMSIRGSEPHAISKSRDGERLRFMDPRVLKACEDKGVEFIKHTEY